MYLIERLVIVIHGWDCSEVGVGFLRGSIQLWHLGSEAAANKTLLLVGTCRVRVRDILVLSIIKLICQKLLLLNLSKPASSCLT
jgi:hypothetical protein